MSFEEKHKIKWNVCLYFQRGAFRDMWLPSLLNFTTLVKGYSKFQQDKHLFSTWWYGWFRNRFFKHLGSLSGMPQFFIAKFKEFYYSFPISRHDGQHNNGFNKNTNLNNRLSDWVIREAVASIEPMRKSEIQAIFTGEKMELFARGASKLNVEGESKKLLKITCKFNGKNNRINNCL